MACACTDRNDPFCGRIERRLPRLLARNVSRHWIGIDCQQPVALHLPTRNLYAAQVDDVLPLLQRQVVGDVDRRHQKSKLLRQVLAQ